MAQEPFLTHRDLISPKKIRNKIVFGSLTYNFGCGG